MNQDYDSYELNPLDKTRIEPLLEQVKLNDLSFKFFISSVYWTDASYDVVQKHNKEIRRTIRSFFKEDIRMWFFIEKHREGNRFSPSYPLRRCFTQQVETSFLKNEKVSYARSRIIFCLHFGEWINRSTEDGTLAKSFPSAELHSKWTKWTGHPSHSQLGKTCCILLQTI